MTMSHNLAHLQNVVIKEQNRKKERISVAFKVIDIVEK